MRLYELVLVLKASLSEAERKKLLDTVKGLLKDLKITKEEEMGQKPLAYPIRREVAGFYTVMQFEGEGSIPEGFETRLIQNDNILRHLVLRKK